MDRFDTTDAVRAGHMVSMSETTRERRVTEPIRKNDTVAPLVIAAGYHHLEVDTDPCSGLPFIDAFDGDELVMRVNLSVAQASSMAAVLSGASRE